MGRNASAHPSAQVVMAGASRYIPRVRNFALKIVIASAAIGASYRMVCPICQPIAAKTYAGFGQSQLERQLEAVQTGQIC